MKKIFVVSLILFVMLSLGSVFAQVRGNEKGIEDENVQVQPKKEAVQECEKEGKECCEMENLTPEQKTKFEALRIAHEKQMIDLKANLEKAMLAKKELFNSGKVDRNSVLAAEEKIMSEHMAIQKARVNHQMDVYEMLTDDQKKEWLEKFEDKMDHRMGNKCDRPGMKHEKMREMKHQHAPGE